MNEERRVSGTTLWRATLLVLAGVVLYVAYQAERPPVSPDAPVDLARALWYLACSITLVVVLTLFAGRGRWSWSLSETTWLRLVLLAGLVFMAVGGVAAVRRAGGAPDVIAVAALGLGLLLLPLWRPAGWRVLLACLLAGVALRLVLVPYTLLDARQADMLPLIQAAGQRLLQGQSPYGLYAFHDWSLPLTYLPVTWLAYLPAVAWGADLRLVNVAASAGAVVILWAAARRSAAAPLVGALFLLPQLVAFDLYAEVAVFWLVLTAFL
ncbi:MAG: hypothetical protein KJ734_06365, partial [Chloroflexi bacterium]|nr:hypothetical protein [Chloroflexota bacterium]